MIIPSIDLVDGRAVQLVGGEVEAIDAGDPVPILERFSVAGEVAVIDIDAARGEGTNRDLIRRLCRLAPVRVGGGIREVETALDWLDAGAEKVIIGTGATPELLSQLPAHRVIVALDSRNGDVVTHGWRRTTGASVLERIAELRDLCGGFLVTFVEREGRMRGTDVDHRDLPGNAEPLQDGHRVASVDRLHLAADELDGTAPDQVDGRNDHGLTSGPLARSSSFNEPTVVSPSCRIEAASTAVAPAESASRRWRALSAPPEAMIGTVTAEATAAMSSRS